MTKTLTIPVSDEIHSEFKINCHKLKLNMGDTIVNLIFEFNKKIKKIKKQKRVR